MTLRCANCEVSKRDWDSKFCHKCKVKIIKAIKKDRYLTPPERVCCIYDRKHASFDLSEGEWENAVRLLEDENLPQEKIINFNYFCS